MDSINMHRKCCSRLHVSTLDDVIKSSRQTGSSTDDVIATVTCRHIQTSDRKWITTRLLIVCAMTSLMTSCTAQWVERPMNTSARLGASATLNCSGGQPTGVIWSKVTATGRLTLFVDTESWTSPSPRLTVTALSQGGFALTVANLTTDDDALYQCEIIGSQVPAQASITVLVSPGMPVLSVQSGSVLREGQIVVFNCSTTGGNPPPSYITWYRNGRELSDVTANATVTPPTAKFGTTVGLLSWRLSASDDLANFSCSVASDVISGSRIFSNVQQFRVEYAPIITVLPRSDTVVVIENMTLTLQCLVNAYPPVNSITWYKNDVAIGGGSSNVSVTWTLRSDAGLYVCSATNFITTNHSVNVVVHYRPRMSVVADIIQQTGSRNKTLVDRGQLEVSVTSQVTMTCVIDAMPMTSSVTWYRNGSMLPTGSANDVIFTSVRRSDVGQYECRANNTLTPTIGQSQASEGRVTFTLVVMYEPGETSVARVGSQLISIIGDNVTLNCSISDPGVPAATLNWTKVNSTDTIAHGQLLQLTSVALQDIGIYTCTASNRIGQGRSASIYIDIIEPPRLTSMTSLPTSRTVSINNTGLLSFNCVGQSRPPPRVIWYKDGHVVDNSWYSVTSQHNTVDTYSTSVTSTLQWSGVSRSPMMTSLRVDDVGVYECLLTFNMTSSSVSSARRSLQLIVHYPPIMRSTFVHQAVDISQSAELICHAQATPTPMITWHSNMTSLSDVNKYVISENNVSDGQYSAISTLRISDVRTADFGIYWCTAENFLGRNVTTFNLTATSVPSAPSDLRVLRVTWGTVELAWTPGYDGGYSQTFIVVVQYHVTRPTTNQNAGNVTRFNVTGLYPSTRYILSVFGENQLGAGQRSANISAITDDLTMSRPMSVQYVVRSRALTFVPVNRADWCIRVRVIPAGQVTCLDGVINGSVILGDDVSGVTSLEVAFCIRYRTDVCGPAQNATIVSEGGLTETEIIIIAVVCVVGPVLILLLVAFLCVFCSHRICKSKDKPSEVTDNSIVMERMNNMNGRNRDGDALGVSDVNLRVNNNRPNGHWPSPPELTSYDNHALDLSDPPYFMNAAPASPLSLHNGNGIPLSPPPYSYPSPKKTRGVASDSSAAGSNDSDSGVIAPNSPRHGRVIHEVIV